MPKVVSHPFKSVLSTNSTATSFTAKTPTTTKPSGDAVLDLFNIGHSLGEHIPEELVLIPYGTDANDETFDMRVWGWSRDVTDPNDVIWIPVLIIELNCTLGNITFTDKGASHFLVDTLVEAAGDTTGVVTVSPANDTAARCVVPTDGAQLLEFDFDMILAAGANCLYRVFY